MLLCKFWVTLVRITLIFFDVPTWFCYIILYCRVTWGRSIFLALIYVAAVLLIGEILLGHKTKETFFDIFLSLVSVLGVWFVYKFTPEDFVEKAIPAIIITMTTIILNFFLFKPMIFKSYLPHDLQHLTIPLIGFWEFGFTILIIFIDGFIDITFKVKSGETSVNKLKTDF